MQPLQQRDQVKVNTTRGQMGCAIKAQPHLGVFLPRTQGLSLVVRKHWADPDWPYYRLRGLCSLKLSRSCKTGKSRTYCTHTEPEGT